MASTPLGKVSRRFEDSYSGMNQGGHIFRIAESPTSTMVSRTSALVCPTRAIGLNPSFAHLIICWAPALVLPPPRPHSDNQTYQAQAGGSCLGLAQNSQSNIRASASFGLRLSIAFSLSFSGSKAIDCASEFSVFIRYMIPPDTGNNCAIEFNTQAWSKSPLAIK
ncbi:hypothetical protein ES703_112746 [subsurface metagenome]